MRENLKLFIICIVFFLVIFGIDYGVANKEIIGDVNSDGVVSELDLEMVQGHLLGRKELSKLEQRRADTNKDGVIDIVDLANIQKIILGVD